MLLSKIGECNIEETEHDCSELAGVSAIKMHEVEPVQTSGRQCGCLVEPIRNKQVLVSVSICQCVLLSLNKCKDIGNSVMT